MACASKAEAGPQNCHPCSCQACLEEIELLRRAVQCSSKKKVQCSSKRPQLDTAVAGVEPRLHVTSITTGVNQHLVRTLAVVADIQMRNSNTEVEEGSELPRPHGGTGAITNRPE